MSSRITVQHLLEDCLDVHLKYYTLVKVNGNDRYFCIAQHSFFVVSFDEVKASMASKTPSATRGSRFFLAYIDRVVVDAEFPDACRIELGEHGQLLIETPIRTELLNELQVFWKTDTMARLKIAKEFPVVEGMARAGGGGASKALRDQLRKPPSGQAFVAASNFFFFTQAAMHRDGTLARHECLFGSDFAFSDEIGFSFPGSAKQAAFLFTPEQSVTVLGRSDRSSIRLLAEKVANALALNSPYVLMESVSYRKKKNLTGDPASWRCWEVRIRLEERDIAVIVARRKFCPPFAESFQDMAFILVDVDGTVASERADIRVPLRIMADSVSPLAENFVFDDLVIERKLDALLLDDESYAWFWTQLRRKPKYNYVADAFCRGVCNLLMSECGMTFSAPIEDLLPVDETNPRNAKIETMPKDPMEVALVQFAQEVEFHTGKAPNEVWRRKTSAFLAYAIDGATLPDINLSVLVNARKSPKCTPEGAAALDRILDYLLFLRPVTGSYNPTTSLQDKARDEFNVMNHHTCNEKVLCRLLECNYFDLVFGRPTEDSESDLLTQFYVHLLNDGQVVKAAVTAQFALLSGEAGVRPSLFARNIPRVLLNDVMKGCKDSFVLESSAKALVNLVGTASPEEKEKVISQLITNGIVEITVAMLAPKHPELAVWFANLVKNCSVSETYRLQFSETVAPMIILLRARGSLADAAVRTRVITAVSSALWSLCRTPSLIRVMAVEGLVVELAAVLAENDNPEGMSKACGCLMVMASDTDVRLEICRRGVIQSSGAL